MDILTVGRYVADKDYFTALKSIKLLLESVTNITYTIIGWGEKRAEIENTVDRLGLKRVVRIVSGSNKINRYFQEADIYLSTSIQEGLSNSIMEAASHSLPIIATNVGDNDRIIVNNETGYITPLQNPDIISKHLIVLAKSQELRNKMGKKGYQHLKKTFSVPIFSNRYFDLISSLPL